MRKIYFLIGILIVSFMGNAQDIHFSQYYAAPLTVNPANTGVFDGSMRGVTNYKDQWRSIANPYQTFSLSFDMKLLEGNWDNLYLGAGVNLYRDKAGELGFGTTKGDLLVSSVLHLNDKNYLSGGLQFGLGQRSIDREAMKWEEQYIPGSGFNNNVTIGETSVFENHTYPDVGVGLLWGISSDASNTSSYDAYSAQAGVAYHHFNKPQRSFFENGEDEISPKLVAHGQGIIPLASTNISFTPSVFYAQQNNNREIVAGSMVRYQLKEQSKITGFVKETAFAVGGYYRVGDALIIASNLEVADFKLGLSYDVNMSGLTVATSGRGGFEISLTYIHPAAARTGKSRI